MSEATSSWADSRLPTYIDVVVFGIIVVINGHLNYICARKIYNNGFLEFLCCIFIWQAKIEYILSHIPGESLSLSTALYFENFGYFR